MSRLTVKLLRSSTLSLLISTSVYAQAPMYKPRLEIAGTVGTERHYGELDILIPLFQGKNTLFFSMAVASGAIRTANLWRTGNNCRRPKESV
ncbi:MAG: hypothetical protein JKY45_02105 [Emcibacter sp.]|nr:hypothetical protein [Emcibacter sp.]